MNDECEVMRVELQATQAVLGALLAILRHTGAVSGEQIAQTFDDLRKVPNAVDGANIPRSPWLAALTKIEGCSRQGRPMDDEVS